MIQGPSVNIHMKASPYFIQIVAFLFLLEFKWGIILTAKDFFYMSKTPELWRTICSVYLTHSQEWLTIWSFIRLLFSLSSKIFAVPHNQHVSPLGKRLPRSCTSWSAPASTRASGGTTRWSRGSARPSSPRTSATSSRWTCGWIYFKPFNNCF